MGVLEHVVSFKRRSHNREDVTILAQLTTGRFPS